VVVLSAKTVAIIAVYGRDEKSKECMKRECSFGFLPGWDIIRSEKDTSTLFRSFSPCSYAEKLVLFS
jgi:hypothetical protein